MTFTEWWMKNKPAECDELKQWFEECWNESGKESEKTTTEVES